ncbi:BamA/TamA family outer membrane protein [Shewanella colwelliana]|uniref:BamA/TamA family outer membrane protein n=1 Tax=Shewanella colwelliana TaxID=23 RepID=UPI00299CD860|nr:BamA/TamA family outer membrane protein [Shewanella colwelliana]MDX1281875.1 BamA/TamA family outer membrane protein [Shewanella colwelliana]
MGKCYLNTIGIALLLAIMLNQVLAVPAANVKSAVNRAETSTKVKENLVLPYLFSTDTMGFNLGVGGMLSGYYQEQMTIGGTVFGGEVSRGIGGGVWNYKLPKTERFFLSVYGMLGYYPQQKAYAGSTDEYIPYDRPLPGSNGSSNEQFLQADGASNWFDIKLEYALPFGATKESGRVEYQIENGLLVSAPSGGEVWNPLSSGATVLVLRQFNRYQSFEFEEDTLDGAIHALELGILYDNTDFPINPSYGSSQYLSISHDSAWLESDHEWTFINLDMSKYFSLGSSDYASQRVIALNFWTGYSPSWALEYDELGGRRVTGNAPYNEGATLGGFYRMRGFDQSRFHDKAAIYGTAEYRYTFKANPVEDINWLRFLRLDWFQLVGFVEAGRVAPSFKASELFSDIKYDFGVSLRALMAGLVVRSDIAHSEEGTNLWIMVDHPF